MVVMFPKVSILRTVWITCNPDNHASRKTCENQKTGSQKENRQGVGEERKENRKSREKMIQPSISALSFISANECLKRAVVSQEGRFHGLTLSGHGSDRIRPAGRHHELDLCILDKVAGDLSGTVRIGLGVLNADGYRMQLSVSADDAAANCLFPALDRVALRNAKRGKWPGDGAHVADLDLCAFFDPCAHARSGAAFAAGGRRTRGRTGG